VNGFLCVNKPIGPSSFQIVNKLRRILNIKKIGHAGTLDPEASGLLVIAIGTATRLLQYIPSEPKVYEFGITFGSQTDTLDREGTVTDSGKPIPDLSTIVQVLPSFTGRISQVPPVYSALLINGVRAYELARGGKTVEMQPRDINIHRITLKQYDQEHGEVHLCVECSGGTYVRSLARDIAHKCGTIGFASCIHRTAIGLFTLDQALPYESLENASKHILSFDKVFTRDICLISDIQRECLLYGRDFEVAGSTQNTLYAFYNNDFMAVLKHKGDSVYHPSTVISGSAGSQ
jgi:tRNA pseudouridine55 synthase